jgi:hypothetical protein
MNDNKIKIVKTYLKLIKKLKRKPTLPELALEGVSTPVIRTAFHSKQRLEAYLNKHHKTELNNISSKSARQAKEEVQKQKQRAELIDIYCGFIKKKIYFPTITMLADKGATQSKIKAHFPNTRGFRDAAKEAKPELFKGSIGLSEYLKPNNVKDIKNVIKSHKRFFITTAVNGQEVDLNFLQSIKTFCEAKNAALLILPSHDPAHNLNNVTEWHFDDKLIEQNAPIIFEELNINQNMILSGIRVTAKQINPTTGLGRITKGTRSFIFASPKQSLEFIPNSNRKLPHAMMSTGACTLPDYSTTRGNSQRTAYLADFDHVMGGIIVEIEDSKNYHFRQVQADKNKGTFIDLGLEYSPEGIERVEATMILGDIHAAGVSESALKATEEMLKELKVNRIVIHDLFDGDSVNHHEENNLISQAIKAKVGRLSLEEEIKVTSAIADRLLNMDHIKTAVIPDANHNNFIHRWLQRGRFQKEPHNFALGCKLAALYVEGKDPLQEALKLIAPLKHAKKVKWLDVDEDYIVAGVQLGSHGDLGPSGSRGSAVALERALVNAIIAHSHTPRIIRGLFQVGTLSELFLGYNKGPSSWMHCNGILYSNGTRQLVNIINGKWKLNEK